MKLLGSLTIWPTVLDWCLFGRVISAIAFRSLFSANRLLKRTEPYWNSSKACFLNHTFTFYTIGLLDKSCMWKRKKLQYKIPATNSSYYINSEYFRSCKKVEKLALLIASEDKSNKPQNQATHSFSLTTKPKLSTYLIFLSLLQKPLSLDELLFRLLCTTTNLSNFPRTLLTITVPEIRTTRGTTPIVAQHVQSFYVIACMKRFLSMPLWLMNRNVFVEKRHSARVSYSLSTICLLQLKCNTRNVTR